MGTRELARTFGRSTYVLGFTEHISQCEFLLGFVAWIRIEPRGGRSRSEHKLGYLLKNARIESDPLSVKIRIRVKRPIKTFGSTATPSLFDLNPGKNSGLNVRIESGTLSVKSEFEQTVRAKRSDRERPPSLLNPNSSKKPEQHAQIESDPPSLLNPNPSKISEQDAQTEREPFSAKSESEQKLRAEHSH